MREVAIETSLITCKLSSVIKVAVPQPGSAKHEKSLLVLISTSLFFSLFLKSLQSFQDVGLPHGQQRNNGLRRIPGKVQGPECKGPQVPGQKSLAVKKLWT